MKNRIAHLRIAGPNCKYVHDRLVSEGTWFLSLSGGTITPLGSSVLIHVESLARKAMDWIVVPPAISYEIESPTYKAIKVRSEDGDKHCQWGPEYRVTIGGLEAYLWLGNKSSRNLMSSIRVGGDYLLRTRRCEQNGFIWYIPDVTDWESIDAGD